MFSFLTMICIACYSVYVLVITIAYCLLLSACSCYYYCKLFHLFYIPYHPSLFSDSWIPSSSRPLISRISTHLALARSSFSLVIGGFLEFVPRGWRRLGPCQFSNTSIAFALSSTIVLFLSSSLGERKLCYSLFLMIVASKLNDNVVGALLTVVISYDNSIPFSLFSSYSVSYWWTEVESLSSYYLRRTSCLLSLLSSTSHVYRLSFMNDEKCVVSSHQIVTP
jgi:hypothetical protein